jgi:hypothetical protein
VDVWNNATTPNDWNTALLGPFIKKGSKLECSNYGGTSLLNVTYNILTIILVGYIEPYAEQFPLDDYQCGSRKRNRCTTDHVSTLPTILEKFSEHDTHLYQLYVDFKQAFDSFNRTYILDVKAEFGIPNKVINLTKMTLSNTLKRLKFKTTSPITLPHTVGSDKGTPYQPC